MEGGRRILIVEDEALVALDIEARLASLGYTAVGIATTHAQALERARALRPDLVLMDINLRGELDGIAAAERLRSELAVPVVFLTAFADPGTLERAKRVSPYGYIVKPYDERDLRTTIEIALHRDGLDRALRRSQEDLLAVLDVQRTGLLLVDAGGSVLFANAMARRVRGAVDEALEERSWPEALGVDGEGRRAIEASLRRPPSERKAVTVTLSSAGVGERVVSLEVEDDPRDGAQKILFLTDVTELHDLRSLLDDQSRFHDLVGRSDAMRRVAQLIRDLAAVEVTVLIEGETGTGKELVARAIHRESRRRDGSFLAVNCAGLSEELAASQLFGHRRGAFTGAVSDAVGVFEAANGGTLFLDEVGDLPPRVQTTLLRVLEERKVMRLGETRSRDFDARILAATNVGLAAQVAQGRFRADLLYRLRVGRIDLPPLRSRREDLWLLVRHALAEHRAATGRRVENLSDEAMRAVLAYDWPGNVRELKNALGYAVIHSRGSRIELEDLPPELLETSQRVEPVDLPLDDRERLLAALERTGGERKAAAALLGMSRATLYRKLALHGIS